LQPAPPGRKVRATSAAVDCTCASALPSSLPNPRGIFGHSDRPRRSRPDLSLSVPPPLSSPLPLSISCCPSCCPPGLPSAPSRSISSAAPLSPLPPPPPISRCICGPSLAGHWRDAAFHAPAPGVGVALPSMSMFTRPGAGACNLLSYLQRWERPPSRSSSRYIRSCPRHLTAPLPVVSLL
jgi:hypothetical protein